MRIALPSGASVEVTVPSEDFPRLIDEFEEREAKVHDDVKTLKRMARQLEAWPVAEPEKEGAK